MKAIYVRGRRIVNAILNRDKLLETRNSPTLDRFIGETVGIILTGCGKPKLVGYARIVNRHEFNSLEDFRAYEAVHCIAPGSRWDYKPGKVGYWLADAIRCDEITLEPVKGNRIWREI